MQIRLPEARLKDAEVKRMPTVNLSFTLRNTGKREGDEVAQVYFRHVNSAVWPRLA